MDEFILKQLKESRYYHPEITDVIHDFLTMYEIALDSFLIVKKGYDTVWDSSMFNHAWLSFREGLQFLENQLKEKGIVSRLIVEVTKDNIDNITSLNGFVVRHLDDIKGNFGIFDNRAYMVYIFNKGNEVSYQTLWSNSKVLVDKQRALFEKLWETAAPLAVRKKEIEYEDKSSSGRTITDYADMEREIESFIRTCKKELAIISSNRILSNIISKSKFLNYFPSLIESGAIMKILTDDVDKHLIERITAFNDSNPANAIQFRYTDKLGYLDEMTIISDNRYLLEIKYDQQKKLIATFSNEEHYIQVQEIMFEKYWNEIKSMEITNN